MCPTIEMVDCVRILQAVDYLLNAQLDLNWMNWWLALTRLIVGVVNVMDHCQILDCSFRLNLTMRYLLSYNYLDFENEIDLKCCHRMVTRNRNVIFSYLLMMI